MIPKRLIRVVPEETSHTVEDFWLAACKLHPTWDHVTLRDPIDSAEFPLTRDYWASCESGAQLADLIRAEEIYWRGGVYIDSDMEILRPLDPLLGVNMFAGWQDGKSVCNALFGAQAGHLALKHVIELSLKRHSDGTLWSGIMSFDECVRNRTDLLLLPPGSFFPYHWTVKEFFNKDTESGQHNRGRLLESNPWIYAIHHWADSWKGSREAALGVRAPSP